MTAYPKLTLAPGRERSVRLRHPWVFSGAVSAVEGDPAPGAVVDVVDADGRWQGRGFYSPASKIRVRVAGWSREDPLDDETWRRRLHGAVRRRAVPRAGWSDGGRRLVYSESDGLPGLIVDRYGRWLVVQNLSAAAEARRGLTVEVLQAAGPDALEDVAGIWERSEAQVRDLEGLAPRTGAMSGDEPPARVTILEGDARFAVDLRGGHKTGFYLDQRENRRRSARRLGRGRVLNAYAYTGGFGVTAALAGAETVCNVDSSGEALALARDNFASNGISDDRVEFVEGDVPGQLRGFRDRGAVFDGVVLDPPKFARGAAQLQRASRAYKDINLLAMKLLRPGGHLVTFSCSGAMDPELFRKVLAGAALDSGREVVWLEQLAQADDHPMPLAFPEAAYLCGYVCRVD